jgi:hypothetical protein
MSDLKTSDLIRATRRLVQGNQHGPINTLASNKDDAATAAVMTFPVNGVQVGMAVEIGWVEYVVANVNVTSKTLDLLPEIEGTAIDHLAGARVNMKPRYSSRRIIEELNNDLMDLSAQGIYKLQSVAGVDGVVDPPEGAVVILDVWDEETTSRRHAGVSWRLSDSPSGPVLIGDDSVDVDYMVFGCTLGQLSLTVDQDITTATGLVSTAEDLPPLGAALRLLAGAEAQRNLLDTQGETRRAGEVPPGALTGALRNLAAIRQSRVTAEAQRFQQRYGVKMHLAI